MPSVYFARTYRHKCVHCGYDEASGTKSAWAYAECIRGLVGKDLATHLTTIDVDITAVVYSQYMLRVLTMYMTHTPELTVLIVTPATGAAIYTKYRLNIW